VLLPSGIVSIEYRVTLTLVGRLGGFRCFHPADFRLANGRQLACKRAYFSGRPGDPSVY